MEAGAAELSECAPIPLQKTIMLVNNFIVSTTKFMNQFSLLAEQKLSQTDVRITQLQVLLSILETKLDSIPGLGEAPNLSLTTLPTTSDDHVLPEVTGPVSPPTTDSVAIEPVEVMTPESEPTIVEDVRIDDTNGLEDPPIDSPPVAVTQMKLRDHPDLAGYFKMERLGVLKAQIKLKMKHDGHDPNLLDTPDAPVPDNGPLCVPEAAHATATPTATSGDES